MRNHLTTLDILVFLVYSGRRVGLRLLHLPEQEKGRAKHQRLLPGRRLADVVGHWRVSMIASNISAEQFIGMSGSGFKVGVAVAAYEWVAAIVLIIVAVFFMPVFLKEKIFTMPQFLEQRYNSTLSLIMSIFWLFLYVLVNLTSILYLGRAGAQQPRGRRQLPRHHRAAGPVRAAHLALAA